MSGKPKTEYKEKAVYTGRRRFQNGKVVHRFQKSNGEEMFFGGIKGVWIGFTYKCGGDSISRKPERTDDERIDNPEWDAADALIDAQNRVKRMEKRLAANTKPALKEAIDALIPLVRGLRNFDRDVLVKYLVDQAMKKAFKKGKK